MYQSARNQLLRAFLAGAERRPDLVPGKRPDIDRHQPLAQVGPTGFARQDDLSANCSKRIGHRTDVRGLACSIDALKAEKKTRNATHAVHCPRWYLFTARLCSSRVALN